MKKALYLISLFSISLLSTAADTLLIDDAMLMPLRRNWTLVGKNAAADWKVEQKVTVNVNQLQVRPGRNAPGILTGFEITDAVSGKKVFSVTSPQKKLYFPWLNQRGEYVLKASGKATAKPVYISIDSLPQKNQGSFILNWNNTVTTAVQNAAPGGIELTPSGKLNFIQSALYSRLKKGQNYRMEFEVTTFEEQNVELRARWGKGSKNFGNRIFTVRPTDGVRKLTMDFIPQEITAVSLTIYFNSKLQIRRFRLYAAAPAPSVRSRMIGKSKALFEHRNPSPEPLNPALKAPVFFQRPPRMIYFDSIPQPHEIVEKIGTFTAPGEFAVWCFGVHNPAGDRKIGEIKVSDLKCGNELIPAKNIELDFVEFQDYPMTASNFMNIPERILPQEMQKTGELNRLFWLTTRIPANTKPGIYSGSCQVICSGKALTIPLILRVLPFKLKKPSDVHWTMYTNLFHGQKARYSRAAHKRYLQDMKDYGIESMQVMAASEAKIKYIQELRKEIGMTGPMVLAGLGVETRIPKELGYKSTKQRLVWEKNGKSGLWYEFPDIRAAVIERMKQADRWIKKYGGKGFDRWYYEGHDEPHLYKDRWASAIWQCKLAKAAGVKTASCTYPVSALEEIGPYLDISTNMLIGSNPDSNRKLMNVGKKHKINFVYLGAGSYKGQEGGLMPNRLMAGLRMFKLGLKGHSSYTYMEPDYPVNHFERGKRYHMAYPVAKRPDGKGRVIYSTLQLEGLREGITDYKYLYTLKCAIDNARKSGKTVQADAAEKVLNKILADVPFASETGNTGNGVTQKQHFSNTTAEHIRMLVANEIIKLQNVTER